MYRSADIVNWPNVVMVGDGYGCMTKIFAQWASPGFSRKSL